MKKIFALLLALLMLASVLAGCASEQVNNDTNPETKPDASANTDVNAKPAAEKAPEKSLKIVTTIFPEYDWVREVLGDQAENDELTMLLDNGVDLRSYRELSGGQQQRVLLARALCATQKMLLLDEPVSGLDPKVTAEMYALIEKLNRKDGITVIMISHDIAAAAKYASHILHIGDTVFFGTKAGYLQSPQGRLFAAEKGGEDQ